MAYVIYHKNTHKIFTGRKGNRTWCTKWYAQKAAMKMNANMLGSVEPLLLVVAALLMGERIQPGQEPMYALIGAGVLLLALEGGLQVRRPQGVAATAG